MRILGSVILVKKIAMVMGLILMALIAFGYLPKDVSRRLSRALIILFVVGFALRVGAYLLHYS